MALPNIQTNFSGGELAPDLWGHVDLSRYAASSATARNMFVSYRGGLFSRAGTAFVGRCKQEPPAAPPRDIPFQFSLAQSYVLEFGEQYMRIKTQGAYVLEASVAITNATQANPCVITAMGHNYVNGDWVYIVDVGGMTQLNGNTYIVGSANIGAGTFALLDFDGNNINSTGYGAYTSGGTVARYYTLSTPYAAEDLPYLKFAQSADVMSLTLVNLATGTEYPPYELKRLAATNWSITPLSLGADVSAPTGLSATASDHPDALATPPTKPCSYAYQVTAVDLTTGEESVASARVDVTDSVDMSLSAGSITVGWGQVVGCKYNVYRTAANYNTDTGSTTDAFPPPAGSLFFYAGSAYGLQFIDANIVTDATKTPPLHIDPFAPGQVQSIAITASNNDWTTAAVSITSGTGTGFTGEVVLSGGGVAAVIVINPGFNYLSSDTVNITGDGTGVTTTLAVGPLSGTYPAVSAYFQQRRVYANSLNQPDTLWCSQTGLFTNFDAGDPPNDNDAITASPFSQSVDGIQWLLPMPGGLVTLTGRGAWQITGSGGSALTPQPITPSSSQAQPQAFNGVHDHVPPIRINYDILYIESRGSWVRGLNYNITFNVYASADLSWPSAHLFEGHQVEQWAWSEEPYKVIWVVREDGVALSLTYVREQEVAGWTRHDTQGLFVGVCAVTEPSPSNKLYLPPTDATYFIAERYVQGKWLYFSERMNDRIWKTAEDSWCVDCGLSTAGAAAYPDATLTASAASGAVTLTADPGVFAPGNVGAIVRAGGGIATITGFTSPTSVNATWTRPMTDTIPDDPNSQPAPAQPLTWTMLAPITTLSGLGHLAGKQVVGVADGIPIGPLTVSGTGTVVLPFTASLVTVGLKFTPQFQSLYLETRGETTVQGARKALFSVTARVAASGFPRGAANESDGSALDPPQTAPAWSNLQQLKPAPPGAAPATYQTAAGQTVTPLYTGDLHVPLKADWKKTGQVAIEQNQPLPLNLLAVVPQYLPGDTPEMTYQNRPRQAARQ